MGASIPYIPEPSALQHLLESRDGPVGRHIEHLGAKVVGFARADAPVGETRKLRNSIRWEWAGSANVLRVIADVDYSRVVHQGSKPHEIRPKRATVLRFPTKGGPVVFTPVVHHPGTKPQPFLMEALRRAV